MAEQRYGIEYARRLGQPTQRAAAIAAPSSRMTVAAMRRAVPEAADLSDRDLVELWSSSNGRDFAQLADEVGLPVAGDFAEVGRQAVAGLTVDLPRMAGLAAKYFADDDSATYRFGQGLVEGADRREMTSLLDPRGGGMIRNEILAPGARALVPSLAAMAPMVATAPLSVPGTVGVGLSALGAGALFGGSSAQDTYERVLKETGDEALASSTAAKVGLVQGAGETAATFVGGRLLRPIATAVRGAPTTAKIAGAMTDTRVLRPLLTDSLKNVGYQVATEIGQDVGTAAIERNAGLQTPDYLDIARQSGLASLGMSLFLGVGGVAGARSRARNAEALKLALDGNEAVPADLRAQALQFVNTEADRQGVALADRDKWVREQLLPAEQRKTETLDRIENIRAQLALANQDDTATRDILVSEFQTLMNAQSGEVDANTSAPLTNGQLFSREMQAYRALQETRKKAAAPGQPTQPTQAEAEVDLTPRATPQTVDEEQLANDLLDPTKVMTPEQLEAVDVSSLSRELQDEFAKTLALSKRERIALPARAARLRRATEIAGMVTPVPDAAPVEQAAPDVAAASEVETDLTADTARVAAGLGTVNAMNATQDADTARIGTGLAEVQRLNANADAARVRGAFGAVQGQLDAPDAESAQLQGMTPEDRARVAAGLGAVNAMNATQNADAARVGTGFAEVQRRNAEADTGRVRGAFEQVQRDQLQQTEPVPTIVANARKALESRTDEELRSMETNTKLPTYQRRAATDVLKSRKPAAPVQQEKQAAPETVEQVTDEEASADADAIAAVLDAIDKEESAEVLKSSVAGGATGMQAGRITFSTPVFAAIRNAVLNPDKAVVVREPKSSTVDRAATTKYREQIRSLGEAVRNFSDVYHKILDSSGQMLRGTKASLTASDMARAAIDKKFPVTQAATEELRGRYLILENKVKEMGGTAKDIDGIIRVVKDRVQKRKQSEQDTPQARSYEELDIGLSRGMEALRRGVLENSAFDYLDVRGGDSRLSIEDQERLGAGQPTRVQENVESGKTPYNRPTSENNPVRIGATGFVVDLLEGGTPYEKTLASALDRIFRAMGDKAPNIAFKDGAKGEYDPNTNTITVEATASPEVRLHEALHGGLRYYVYNNQNDPAVQGLMAAVDKIVKYDGPLDDKSSQVQMLLANLVKDKGTAGQLDAALELVSYTNTSNFFRKTMQQIESDASTAPKDFLSDVKSVWNWLREIVNKFLGKDSNLANDVIRNTFNLMNKAAAVDYKNATLTVLGNKLEMAVQSDAAARQAAQVSTVDYKQFTNGVVPSIISSKILFDLANWPAVAGKFKKQASSLAAKIRAEFPALERNLTYVNSFFSVPEAAARFMKIFKHTKNTPYQLTEMTIDALKSRPAEQQLAFVEFMDGNSTALDRFPKHEAIKAMAERLKNNMEHLISQLPDRDRKLFEGRKFSDYLLFASGTGQVAANTYRAINISALAGPRTRKEPVLALEWMNKDSNGDPVLTDSFYQVFGPVEEGGKLKPQNFMSVSKFERDGPPSGMSVDSSRVWALQKQRDGEFLFITNTSAKEAIAHNKGEDVFNALRNTVAALATSYASRRMMAGLYKLGRTDGAIDANAVAFDDVAQIKTALGVDVEDSDVFLISNDEAKAGKIQNKYRASNTWVRMPVSDAYGDMSGKIVSGPVWVSMVDMSDRTPALNYRWYQKSLRFFKNSKTIYNPGTHMTNTVSNFVLAYMHDMTFDQLRAAARVYALFHRNPSRLSAEELQMMMDFTDSGAMLGDISTSEIKESLFDAMLNTDKNDNNSTGTVMQQMQTFVKYEQLKSKIKAVGDAGASMYSAEDNIFRLAAFFKKAGELQAQRKEGTLSEETRNDAGEFARQAFVDYDVDSKAVRMLRSSVLPFVTFTYGILPVLGRIALTKPWKIANVITAMYLAGAATAAFVEDDDEETRKLLPDQIDDRMFLIGPQIYMRMPFSDADNPAYMRVGDYFPLAGALNGMPNGFLGQSGWPQGLSPSNPFINAILTMVGGVDAYSGRPIHEATDTSLDKLWNITKSTYDTFMPPWISSTNMLEKYPGVVTGATGPTGAKLDPAVFARTLAGIRVYNYNTEEAEYFKGLEVQRIVRDYRSAMSKARREEAQKGTPDYEALDATLTNLVERMQKAIDEARGDTSE